MKFDKDKACLELSKLISETELFINRDKYPQLNTMANRGSKLAWKQYFKESKADETL
jgi:hypothetical protein